MKRIITYMLLLVLLLFSACSEDSEDPTGPGKSEPKLAVDVNELNFGADDTLQTFQIGNAGGGDLEWQIASPDAWIRFIPDHGLIRGDTVKTIQVTVHRSNLEVGSYEGHLKITASNNQEEFLVVRMEKFLDDPELYIDVTSLDFGVDQNSLNFVMENIGDLSLEYSIESSETWTNFNPAEGILQGQTAQEIIVGVNRNGLSQGKYTGSIVVTPDFGAPHTISLSMEVDGPDPVTLILWAGEDLDEDHYMYSGEIRMPFEGLLAVEFRLISWPQDYGIELMQLSNNQFSNFQNGNSFSAIWHETVFSTGVHRYVSYPIEENQVFRFVVDNTDLGWEETDFDFVNDQAVFDLIITAISAQ